jgi:hypothetical protein
MHYSLHPCHLMTPALRKTLTFLNRAAAQLAFMVDEVEVRQEGTK